MDREDVKIVHEGQANEKLIEKLRAFREYISDDMPEWKQLIVIGGFVADVIQLLKWEKKPVYHQDAWDNHKYWRYENEKVTSCELICEEIAAAIEYEISAPYADELNAMWQDWHFNDTGKYADIKTFEDMDSIIIARIEKDYPGFEDMIKKAFHY